MIIFSFNDSTEITITHIHRSIITAKQTPRTIDIIAIANFELCPVIELINTPSACESWLAIDG